MAKTDLITVEVRKKLRPKPNRAPYWQRLAPGCFVGYRPAADGAAGTWAAKGADERPIALGSFSEFDEKERFAKAKAAAEAAVSGGNAKAPSIFVADACREYAKGRPDAERFFQKSVYEDPIAIIKLHRLSYADLDAWRKRLEARPTERLKSATRVRAPSSVNREMSPLRAALRKVLAPGHPDPKNPPWQAALAKLRFKANFAGASSL